MLLALYSLWTVTVVVNVTGVSASPSIGTISVNVSAPILGVSASPAIGTTSIYVSIPVSGVSASPSIGTVGFIDDFTVTGVTASARIGTVTFSGTGAGINYGYGEGLRRPKTINRERIRERALSRERVLLRELEKITEPPPIIVVSAIGVHAYPYVGSTSHSIDFSVVRGSPHVEIHADSVLAISSARTGSVSAVVELTDEEILTLLAAA